MRVAPPPPQLRVKPRCERCDDRGWYYTPGGRSLGAARCACLAPISQIGIEQLRSRRNDRRPLGGDHG